jgi:2-polyprenyl-3-methyl-5-hydroxy-6-metoxy-1,4-benzoquinol methylase
MNKYTKANIDIHQKEANRFRDIHPELFNRIEYAIFEKYYAYIARKIQNKPIHLLDLACGTGRLTAYFAEKGCHVTACDLSCDMLQTLTSTVDDMSHISIHTSDVETFLNDNDVLFDGIVMGAFLHHVPDIEALLQEVCKHLTPGGSLFIVHDPAERNKRYSLPGFLLEKIDSILFQIGYFFRSGKFIPRSREYANADLHTRHGIDNEAVAKFLSSCGLHVIQNNKYFIHKTRFITFLDAHIFHL